jgi:hypothetical protein
MCLRRLFLQKCFSHFVCKRDGCLIQTRSKNHSVVKLRSEDDIEDELEGA